MVQWANRTKTSGDDEVTGVVREVVRASWRSVWSPTGSHFS